MLFLRSFLFAIIAFFYSFSIAALFMPAILMPDKIVYKAAKIWASGILFILKIICGISHKVKGKIPEGNFIVAAKHESAWDTIIFFTMLKQPVYILKRELLYTLPIISFYLLRLGFIAVDRAAGASALRKMVKKSVQKVNAGKNVIIFPEGTRVKAGSRAKLQPGITAIYKQGVRVLPVALNSGSCWAKNSFIKKPGVIVISFKPVIEPGLKSDAFIKKLEEAINS